MKLISFLLLLLTLSCSHFSSKSVDKISILQGITNQKEMEFSIVAAKNRTLRFELRTPEGEIIGPTDSKIVTRSFSDFAVYKLLFPRDPVNEYNLYVFDGEKVVDQRLVGRGQKNQDSLSLAVASCMSDFHPDIQKIWKDLVEQNPEYLLLIGDNVYTNKKSADAVQATDPEIIWQRYVDLRFSLPFYAQQKLIPTHALWDDNDYGMNNGNTSFTYRNESEEIFKAFWAQSLAQENWIESYGVSGLLSLGDYNLYFLDGRSFRSESADGNHLGLDQGAWFLSKLREETTPSFIIKGDQFFGGYHEFESYEGDHPKDFLDFVNELKKVKTPFVLLSGDRHMSEIMQFPRSLFGRPSFEITSSPLHARTFENDEKNPWRVVATTGAINFTMIHNKAVGNHWFIDVENIGLDKKVYYRRELAVYIKDLQDNLDVKRRRHGKRRYKKIRPRRRR